MVRNPGARSSRTVEYCEKDQDLFHGRMQFDGTVRLRPVKKESDANVGDVSGDDDENDRLPPRRRPAAEFWHKGPMFANVGVTSTLTVIEVVAVAEHPLGSV